MTQKEFETISNAFKEMGDHIIDSLEKHRKFIIDLRLETITEEEKNG